MNTITRRFLAVGLAGTIAAAGAILAAAETLRIVPLVREGQVFVSVEVNDLNT